MIYKPQTVVDLDTGAIVGTEVLPGDQSDHHAAATSILEAQQNINAARGEDLNQLTMQTATADKGHYAVDQLQALQQEQIKTVICNPISHRRLDKLEPAEQRAIRAAERSTNSQYGKALLRQHGQHVERGFAHILDCGGMRRATLRGLQNLRKRFQLAAACYNLSQLMRQRFGVGTPKQWEAMGRGVLDAVWHSVILGLWVRSLELIKTNPSEEPSDPIESLGPLKIAA